MPEQLDVGLIAVAAIGLFVLVLILLAIRKMIAGRRPEAEALDDEEARALAEEAEAGEAAPGAPEAPEVPSREPPLERPMERGLEKTRKGFMARLNELLFRSSFDESLVDELESLMVTSDIGIRTTERLLGDLKSELSRREIKDAGAVKDRLRQKITEIVALDTRPIDWNQGPTVVMVIGVNGVGKTTTIGKLAARLSAEGKKVVLAAGDTFRAAAVEQLEIWGQRAKAEVVKGQEKQDPSAVVFDAIQRAKSAGADVCICDTAGRLHTKVNLMEELKKLRRVMQKAHEGAPHEVLLVLDATTGQNAITQAKQFKEAVEVNSLALTKLDGTAKGGVVVAICDDLAIPVRYVGIGEKIEDLRDFDPREFVDALFAD
jgi:fused signal recognition particle receptor